MAEEFTIASLGDELDATDPDAEVGEGGSQVTAAAGAPSGDDGEDAADGAAAAAGSSDDDASDDSDDASGEDEAGADPGRVNYNAGGSYVGLTDDEVAAQRSVDDGGEYEAQSDEAIAAQRTVDDGGEYTSLSDEEVAAERSVDSGGEYEGVEDADDAEGVDSGGSYTSSGTVVDDFLGVGAGALADFNTARYISDPPSESLFTVFIGPMPGLAFLECSGLGMDVDVVSIKEGGVNHHEWHFAGTTSHGSLTLRRGYLLDPAALAIQIWRHTFNSDNNPKKLGGLIILHDDNLMPQGAWYFSNGMIESWSAPDMKAGSGEIAVEELVIVHEGLTVIDTVLQLANLGLDIYSQIEAASPSIPTSVATNLL